MNKRKNSCRSLRKKESGRRKYEWRTREWENGRKKGWIKENRNKRTRERGSRKEGKWDTED